MLALSPFLLLAPIILAPLPPPASLFDGTAQNRTQIAGSRKSAEHLQTTKCITWVCSPQWWAGFKEAVARRKPRVMSQTHGTSMLRALCL